MEFHSTCSRVAPQTYKPYSAIAIHPIESVSAPETLLQRSTP